MLLTNFDKSELFRYEVALKIYKKQTDDKDLYIDKNAFWMDGTKDNSLCALRANEFIDRSKFWRIFEKIIK